MQSRNREQRVGAAVLDKTISPDARDWIVAALDPFHDFQRQLAGYPDADTMHTTVACYNYELAVSSPAGVLTNWDAHVFTMPIMHQENMFQIMSDNTDKLFRAHTSVPVPLDQTPHPMAALNCYSAAAGEPLFQGTVNWAPPTGSYRTIDVGPTAGEGMGRVIAWGFEIVNTTADLSKQGALTAYRMPQQPALDESVAFQQTSQTVADKIIAQRLRSPPATSAEAVLLGGTRQWAAADGCYVVVPQSTIANPVKASTNQFVMTSAVTPLATGQTAMMSERDLVSAVNNMPVTTPLTCDPQRVLPFNTCGVFLTGLSPETTFRIKMKMYVEKAPSFTDAQTSVLATPSAAYDARVLEIYSAALSQLPIAVPVGMNGFGDWFRTVLDVVGKLAVPVGALFGPQGALIGAGVASIASTAKQIAYKDETKQAMTKMKNDLANANNPTAPKPMYRVRVGAATVTRGKNQRRK